LFSDVVQAGVCARAGELLLRHFQDVLAIALRVRAELSVDRWRASVSHLKISKKTCNRRHSPVIYLFGGTLHFIKNWLTVGRKDTMTKSTKLGGTFKLVGTSTNLYRMGYGTMQLAGPEVWGPPRDVDAAVAVLREAIGSGVDHIDTSDFYGPHVTNQIIRKALHPYPEDLVIVTKLGAVRGEDASWKPAHGKDDLIAGVHDNLKNLGLDALDVVNLRVGGMLEPTEAPIADKVEVLADLKRQGLIRHVGLSNVTAAQVAEAQAIIPIVCVQNLYNLAN